MLLFSADERPCNAFAIETQEFQFRKKKKRGILYRGLHYLIGRLRYIRRDAIAISEAALNYHCVIANETVPGGLNESYFVAEN